MTKKVFNSVAQSMSLEVVKYSKVRIVSVLYQVISWTSKK